VATSLWWKLWGLSTAAPINLVVD